VFYIWCLFSSRFTSELLWSYNKKLHQISIYIKCRWKMKNIRNSMDENTIATTCMHFISIDNCSPGSHLRVFPWVVNMYWDTAWMYCVLNWVAWLVGKSLEHFISGLRCFNFQEPQKNFHYILCCYYALMLINHIYIL